MEHHGPRVKEFTRSTMKLEVNAIVDGFFTVLRELALGQESGASLTC